MMIRKTKKQKTYVDDAGYIMLYLVNYGLLSYDIPTMCCLSAGNWLAQLLYFEAVLGAPAKRLNRYCSLSLSLTHSTPLL